MDMGSYLRFLAPICSIAYVNSLSIRWFDSKSLKIVITSPAGKSRRLGHNATNYDRASAAIRSGFMFPTQTISGVLTIVTTDTCEVPSVVLNFSDAEFPV